MLRLSKHKPIFIHPMTGPHGSGSSFSYNEALKPGGLLAAVLVSLATGLAGAAAVIAPLRFLIRKVVPKPGQGTSICKACLLCAAQVPDVIGFSWILFIYHRLQQWKCILHFSICAINKNEMVVYMQRAAVR